MQVDLAHGRATLYFDPSKWTITHSPEPNKTSLTHRDGDGYAMIIAERLQLSLDALRQLAITNAKSVAPDTRVVAEQHRRVNGIDVLTLQLAGTAQGVSFIYLGYYYAGQEGAFQVVTYTAANLFDEYKADFEEFLDGFVLTGVGAPPAKQGVGAPPATDAVYVAAMRADLRNLVTAEEAFFADSVKYTVKIGPGGLEYGVHEGNTWPTIRLTRDGWTATIGNRNTPTRCAIFVGATSLPPATKEGAPMCQ